MSALITKIKITLYFYQKKTYFLTDLRRKYIIDSLSALFLQEYSRFNIIEIIISLIVVLITSISI